MQVSHSATFLGKRERKSEERRRRSVLCARLCPRRQLRSRVGILYERESEERGNKIESKLVRGLLVFGQSNHGAEYVWSDALSPRVRTGVEEGAVLS